jgi:hypothetical protein
MIDEAQSDYSTNEEYDAPLVEIKANICPNFFQKNASKNLFSLEEEK